MMNLSECKRLVSLRFFAVPDSKNDDPTRFPEIPDGVIPDEQIADGLRIRRPEDREPQVRENGQVFDAIQ